MRLLLIRLMIVLLFCMHVPSANCVELITNGSFEIDPEPFGGRVQTGWDDGPGLGNDIGLRALLWPYFEDGAGQIGNAAFEFPPGEIPDDFTGTIQPIGTGNFHGTQWGISNGSSIYGSATQVIDVSNYSGNRYDFTAWLASATRDLDHALVHLSFFSGPHSGGTSLGSVVFDGNDQQNEFIIGSLDLDGRADPSLPATQDNWTFYKASGTIPLLAQSASVLIQSPNIPGTINGDDAYVDLVSLQVVPEPASVVLVGILIAVLVVHWWGTLSRRVWARSP